MSTLSKRWDKIATAGSAQAMVLIFLKKAENSGSAIFRHGFDPDDTSRHFMILQFVSPEDGRVGRD